MTNEFAIKVLTELRGYGDKFANIGFDRKEALDMAIKALEQTRWIPVSERLPEEVGAYLLSLHIEAPMCPSLNRVVKGYWTANDKWQFEMESGVIANYYVEAYMPLPQPYKAESEE